MGFDLTVLEAWSDDREFKVEAARTTAYAAATNDTNPKHAAGELAPPLFADGTGEGIGPDGTRHRRFRSWKEALRDFPPASSGDRAPR